MIVIAALALILGGCYFDDSPQSQPLDTPVDADSSSSAPKAALTVSGERLAGTSLTLNAAPSRGEGLSYRWQFGDGDSGKGEQVTHTYDRADTYTVTLTVTDRTQRTDSRSLSLDIQAVGPAAAFRIEGPATAGQPQHFDASGSYGQALTYYWDFGDQDAGRNNAIAHIYDQAGDYGVTLTVTDQAGHTDSHSERVSIAAGPTPVADDGVISGTVTDTDGTPLEDVQAHLVNTPVQDDGHTAVTDAQGQVLLSGMPTGVPFVLKLTRTGYADQFVRTVIPAGTTDATFRAIMTARAAARTLSAVENGGSVSGDDGVRLSLPPGALVDSSGNDVSGAIDVTLTPVDVSDQAERGAFPGSFAAADENGESGQLLSFGVAEFQLTRNGEELQLAPGKQATLTVPIYVSQYQDGTGIATGDSIALWSLDETSGQWVQEGTGTVVTEGDSPTGLAFEIRVGHLSWYNCDAFAANPYRVIPHCNVDDSSGLPTLDASETCYIQGQIDGGGPYSGVATNIDSTNPRALPVPAATDYRLIALARNGTLRGEVTVNGSAGASDDVAIVLTPIGGGTGEAISLPYENDGAIDPADEVDRYTFTGQADQIVRIQAGESAGSDLFGQVSLLGPSGQTLAQAAFADGQYTNPYDAFAGVVLPADGRYTLAVRATDNAPGGYHLSARRVPRTQIDENLSGTLPSDGNSLYRGFQADAGTVIGLTSLAGNRVEVTDAANHTLASTNTFTGDNLVSLPDDGLYFVRVEGGASQDYRTAVARIEPATALVPDSAGRVTVNGDIQVNGDRHFYKLTAAAGDGLFVRLSPGSSEALTSDSAKVRIYRPGRTPLYDAEPIDNADQDEYEFADGTHLYSTGLRLPGDGGDETYLLEVSARYAGSGTELGQYTLRVDTASQAGTLVVDDDLAQCPGADSHSLRAAAYAVTDNGSLDVCTGTYSEYVPVTAPDRHFTVIGRDRAGVILRSEDPDQAVVENDYRTNYSENAAHIQLQNLTLQTRGHGTYFGAQVGSITGATDITVEAAPGETELPGALIINEDGALIDGLDITAGDEALSVNADDVTVRNSHFTGSPGTISLSARNFRFQGNTVQSDSGGPVLELAGGTYATVGGDIAVLDNTVTITSSDPDRLGDSFAMRIADDGTGANGVVVRGNMLDTDAGGLKLGATGAGAHFIVAQNRFTSSAVAGGKLLQAAIQKTSAQQATTLTVRNNIFDGMEALGGEGYNSHAGLTIVSPAKFAAVDIINNSFRATVHDAFSGDNAGMLSIATSADGQPASYPVRLRNNIYQGIDDSTKQDVAIAVSSGVTIDADYGLFFGFDSLYSGGGSSTGGSDISNANPGFTNGQLEVDNTSPAVDAGQGPMAGGVPIPDQDYSGTARPQHGSYDIGAHENVF
ncbi:PKD domain-containing protein [Alcanivorax hongdengensis]|nr:PKD domain-containing protein [Alcanivorax hongdengensis]